MNPLHPWLLVPVLAIPRAVLAQEPPVSTPPVSQEEAPVSREEAPVSVEQDEASNWASVEAAYIELERLATTGTPLTFADHYLGALAARALGHPRDTEQRLTRALESGGETEEIREARKWLDNIWASYGAVSLVCPHGRQSTLLAVQMPSSTEKITVIERARAEVAAGRSYADLLPVGSYTFGELSFTVGAHQAERIYAPQDPAANVPSVQGKGGFRADLGVSWLASSAGSESLGSLSGAGVRVGVGWQSSLGQQSAALAEVGYRAAFGGSPLEGAGLSVPAGVAEGASGDRVHSGFAWVGLVRRLDRVELAAGPVLALSRCTNTSTTESWGSDLPVSAWAWVITGGLTAELSYALVRMGALQGSLALLGGAESDLDRVYGWGQIGFMVSPALGSP